MKGDRGILKMENFSFSDFYLPNERRYGLFCLCFYVRPKFPQKTKSQSKSFN
jgi:hypothetical protein